MVYCIQASLAFSTAGRRDTVLTALTNRLSGRARWGTDELETASFRFGANGIRATLRYTTRANADDLLAQLDVVIAANPGQRTPLAGSWVTIHNCTHDEDNGNCSPDVRRDW